MAARSPTFGMEPPRVSSPPSPQKTGINFRDTADDGDLSYFVREESGLSFSFSVQKEKNARETQLDFPRRRALRLERFACRALLLIMRPISAK